MPLLAKKQCGKQREVTGYSAKHTPFPLFPRRKSTDNGGKKAEEASFSFGIFFLHRKIREMLGRRVNYSSSPFHQVFSQFGRDPFRTKSRPKVRLDGWSEILLPPLNLLISFGPSLLKHGQDVTVEAVYPQRGGDPFCMHKMPSPLPSKRSFKLT